MMLLKEIISMIFVHLIANRVINEPIKIIKTLGPVA